jgi:fructosamine-3-kinase
MGGQELSDQLGTVLGGRWALRALGASSFCDTWEARCGRLRAFVKSSPGQGGDMLAAEADGLQALAAAKCIRVPEVLCLRHSGESEGAWLALEWLDLATPDVGFGKRFATALAALHADSNRSGPAHFGWRRDNFLGATPQVNTPTAGAGRADWVAFFAANRLVAMRDRLPAAAAALRAPIDAVLDALPGFFDQAPRAALIHGDLWRGNWGMLADGTPVIFDPAVSVSDPEAELAMMDLFGGMPAGLLAAYEAAGGVRPDPGRRRLYQLYHLLNHAVLFGGGYEEQALRVARSLA